MKNLLSRVLLATDGSEDAGLALHAAVDLSERIGSELHVIHAWAELPSYAHPSITIATDAEFCEQKAQELLFEQLDALQNTGATVAGTHLPRGRPAERIVDVADQVGANLIVMGSRGLGTVKRLLLGSVSEAVVQLASCPVLVMRGGEEAWPPARIVVGVDLSEESKGAAWLGTALGKVYGARVLLLLAYPKLPETMEDWGMTALEDEDELRQRVWLRLKMMSNELDSQFGYYPRVRTVLGDPASIIQSAGEEGDQPALVVVGSRGLGAVRRMMLGSVSTDVLRAAGGPVLICKPSSV